MNARVNASKNDVIKKALMATRPAFFTAIVFSFFLNLAALAAPLYMLQIYDRVLQSRNVSTLLLLTLAVAFIYAASALLEVLRSKVLIRAGVVFDKLANPGVFRAVQKATILSPSPRHVQSLRDLDYIREFFTGAGLLALCDFPWVPVYIIAAFLLHPVYGILAIVSSILTLILAGVNEVVTKNSLEKANQEAMSANNQSVTTFRNSEVLQAMGMIEALRSRWSEHHEATLGWQAEASNKGGMLIAITKFNRMLVQSLILGVGAYLVIQREVTPGMMIAASIIIGKALQPVEIAISQWKSFDTMRSAYRRLKGMLDAMPSVDDKMTLPTPQGEVVFENVIAAPPGSRTPVLAGISLKIPAGSSVGVVGPSAAGKSSLARVLVSVWPIASGFVRLDGSDLTHWNADQLGENIGYLPQDVELFSGTVAENISRFGTDPDEADIIEAAKIAGCHDMIQLFADGYNTKIGDGGQALSGGQRQRIGLARAVYRLPSLIVLDEPNASLDALGEQALLGAIEYLKKQNRTLILITHKTNVLSAVDYILVMNAGQVQTAGPRDQVLEALLGGQQGQIPAPSKSYIRTVPAA
jgi:PrtD family type I secretion system ABC transporter